MINWIPLVIKAFAIAFHIELLDVGYKLLQLLGVSQD